MGYPLRPFYNQLIGTSMPDELLDIVDAADQVIGQDLRAAVHLRGLQHRGVHIFLVTPDGKLLVQQRGRQRAPALWRWIDPSLNMSKPGKVIAQPLSGAWRKNLACMG